MSGKAKKVSPGTGTCDGCGNCIEACLKANSGKRGRGLKKVAGIKLLRNGDVFVPVVCRNCEDAPCVTACMSGCRHRNGNGRVVTDYTRCIGCWMCIMNCPFGAIERLEREHIALKCEGCPDEETPPCVAACGRGILDHGDVQALSYAARKKAAARFLTGEKEDTPAR
jgi:carbon-monoxide dehydrogenase iron sulfur subunit